MNRARLLRYSIAITVLLLIAAAILWWRVGPVTVAVAPVERGSVVDAIYATGSVEPTVSLPIAPRTGGRLAARNVDEGDRVRKGQVLARLDDADLAATEEELTARAAYARSQHARIQELAARGFISKAEVDRARSELAASESALRRARAQRGYLALTAPADGTIIRRDGEVGQFVAAGQAIFVLECCAPLRVTADIDEEDINRVHVGQKTLLKADAVPGRVYEGSVSEVTPKGDPVARSYRVRIALADAAQLRTGMTVDANLIVATREQALLVPTGAIVDDHVWLLADGELRKRAVQVGIRSAQRSEILKGLDGSERVLLHPDPALREGRAARPAQ